MVEHERPKSYAEALEIAATPLKPNFKPGPEYGASARLFQGIPSMERAPDGRLWAVWVAGGQGESWLNYVLAASSGDDGRTWTEPAVVLDHPAAVRVADPNIWLDPDGRLWLFWTQAHTLHDGYWGVWAITTDEPDAERPTWSEPRRLSDGVMLNKPTVLRNGEWLFPISLINPKCIENEKRMMPAFMRQHLRNLMTENDVREIEERSGAYVCISHDKGATFEWRGCAKVPVESRTHNEHMVAERSDGSLMMLLRTNYGIGQSTSSDGGKTWSPVVESGIPHTSSRFFFRRLASGNLLLVKHGPMEATDANGEPRKFARTELTAYLSEDDGKSWSASLLLEPRGCTYPDGTQAPDGTIYVIYDHGRREQKMVLFASFTEEDIAAGAFVSPRGRQQVLVNQATGVIREKEDWNRIKAEEDPNDPLVVSGI